MINEHPHRTVPNTSRISPLIPQSYGAYQRQPTVIKLVLIPMEDGRDPFFGLTFLTCDEMPRNQQARKRTNDNGTTTMNEDVSPIKTVIRGCRICQEKMAGCVLSYSMGCVCI